MIDLSNKTVLVVDDEPLYREVLREELLMVGATVIEAGSGMEALEKVHGNRIDAVISDVRMPNGDGAFLLDELRKLQTDVPLIIMISGFSQLTTDEAYDRGAEGVFAKPCKIDHILEKIQLQLNVLRVRLGNPETSAELRLEIVADHTFKTLLGRGGFSYVSAKDINVGDVATFSIHHDGRSFNGRCIIRCKHTNETQQRIVGCEFLALDEASLNEFDLLGLAGSRIAYIPRLPIGVAS